MFSVDNDMTISITRGDVATIPVSAVGEAFKLGDIIRIKVFEKKNCAKVIFQKDFGVAEETENFEIILTRNETKIGKTINKPTTYWYEIELNPDTNPNTIVGYDEDGPKLFVLYPEGEDIEYIPPTEEEVGPIDNELSLTSKKPIANHVVAKKTLELDNKIDESAEKEAEALKKRLANEKAERNAAIETEKAERKAEIAVERARINQIITLKEGSTTGDAELVDARVGYDGTVYPSLGEAVRTQAEILSNVDSAVFDVLNEKNKEYTVESGTIKDVTNEEIDNSARMRTSYISVYSGKIKINVPTGLNAYLWVFDAEKKFVRYKGWYTGENTFEIDEPYIRLTFKNDLADETITAEQVLKTAIKEYVAIENKVDKETLNTGLSATNFVFGLTDFKKMAIRPNENVGVFLDFEKGCWLRFNSKITGEVNTTKEQLAEQLGDAFLMTDTTLTITLVLSTSLVFDVIEKKYKIVENTNIEQNHALILGVNRTNVCGVAVAIANYDKLRDLDTDTPIDIETSLTETEINACKEYSSLFANTTDRAEAILFFTDPHLATKQVADGDVSENFNSSLDRIKAVYDNTPISTCVCGGDWLHNGNSKENACWMLGKIDGAMKSRFDKYINVVGNHDTNYQGYNYLDTSVPVENYKLTNNAISNLWYRNYGKNYFAVDGDSTRFYIFDTGIDTDAHQMNVYRWEQVDWFANELLKDNPERCASILHIGTKNYVATPFVQAITQVANAFNLKSSLTLNGKTYNFTNSQGHFYFILSGHAHIDMNFVENGIPVILTINLLPDTAPTTITYDLVLADYGANKIKLVRIGTGESREFDMA